MDTAQLLFLIAFGIFFLYSLVVGIIFGILPSLSASYYALETKFKAGRVFQVMLGSVSLLMMSVLLSVTKGYWFQFLAFFATAPLLFTAAAPKFRSPGPAVTLEAGVHGKSATFAAVMSIILTCCCVIFIDKPSWFLLIAGPLVGLIGYLINKRNNKIYWAEYVCFAIVFILGYILLWEKVL